MTVKHSPGPWRAQGDVVFLGERVSIYDESTWIDCNTKANARLIAAAPELLEALQRLLNWGQRFSGRERAKDVAFARQTVAKALGEQP